MILYLAGNVSTDLEQAFWDIGIRRRLFSYAEIEHIRKEFKFWLDKGVPPFMDSGAYGASTRGIIIDVRDYCVFIQQHLGRIYPYASLDVIGDWQGSKRNYDIMRAYGLHPIPTFHMSSPYHALHEMLQQTDYIALGGVVGAHEYDMRPWLDNCFHIIHQYWPKKVHIFGLMAQWALERYPFYSADSSSAVVGGGMGRVLEFKDGKIASHGWIEYARETLNGDIMDGAAIKQGIKGSAHHGRRVFNAETQLQLQRHITDLWAVRGITWEEGHG